jgi:hypothetical protein
VNLPPYANELVDLAHFRPEHTVRAFAGVPCRVKVRVEPYQGTLRNKVTEVLAPNPSDADGS